MEQNTKANVSLKEKAVSFLQLVASGKVEEAYDRYVSSDFCHHNPYFRGDTESLKAAMKENAAKTPNKTIEVKHAIEEGQMVVVHSHIKQNPEELGAAVVHIFRFHDERIVELWDLGQPVPESSPNKNGMF
jgi:predicted SnoaL-like aldol condensation-catalyzing enzyme